MLINDFFVELLLVESEMKFLYRMSLDFNSMMIQHIYTNW